MIDYMSKQLFISIFFVLFQTIAFTQVFQVNSGGEILNFGTIDLSFATSFKWISDRAAIPGFYSAVDTAIFYGYSDQYNINGYIKKFGNTSFIFPVGDGEDLRMLEISKPLKSTDAYATAWIPGDPGISSDPTFPFPGTHPTHKVTPPIQSVMRIGQWDWLVGENGNLGENSTGDGVGLTIQVSMPDLTSFGSASELRLVGWNGNSWIDLSGKPTAIGNTENKMISGIMKAKITAISIGKIRSTPLGKILLYPNPLIGQSRIQVQLNTTYKGSIQINIYHSNGQKIISYNEICQSGYNTYSIQFADRSAGTYFIDIKDPNGNAIVETKTFIKL
ncbi:MAG: T9SS C-terminal target domain-containing protein [Flavobacteriia bacterium]|nr:T9SS C-terminal target domain-containing protein [Flavobacteriia bacterium]